MRIWAILLSRFIQHIVYFMSIFLFGKNQINFYWLIGFLSQNLCFA